MLQCTNLSRFREQLAKETSSHEARIAELTEALMVPNYVHSLAERLNAEKQRESAGHSVREKELTTQIQTLQSEIEHLKQQLEVHTVSC